MRTSLTFILFLLTFLQINAQICDTLISIEGITMHFKIIKGEENPIVFESGNGDDCNVWETLLKPIHEKTRATLITYDRSGLGKSQIDTSKINFEREIIYLEKGLSKLGFNKNITFVSHSFGGYYTTLFAYRNPKKVKGIVFIDVLTPCFFTKQRAQEMSNTINEEMWKMIHKEAIGLFYVLKNLESIQQYMQNIELSATIPAIIIGAENPPKAIKEKAEWISCLKEFGSSINHNYIIAKDCSHKVWQDNPALVISEIIKIFNK